MKKYKIVFTIIVISSYLAWLYFDYILLSKDKKVYLKDLNTTIIDMNKFLNISIESIHSTGFKYWDIDKSELLKRREKSGSENNVSLKDKKNENIKSTIKTVCIGKRCWEFMGVVQADKNMTVSLISKDKKTKLETFSIGDELLENLVIIDIKGESMKLLDKDKNKELILKVFEINASKYYPKKKIKEQISKEQN